MQDKHPCTPICVTRLAQIHAHRPVDAPQRPTAHSCSRAPAVLCRDAFALHAHQFPRTPDGHLPRARTLQPQPSSTHRSPTLPRPRGPFTCTAGRSVSPCWLSASCSRVTRCSSLGASSESLRSRSAGQVIARPRDATVNPSLSFRTYPYLLTLLLFSYLSSTASQDLAAEL